MRDEHLAGTVDGELDGHDALDDDVLDRLHQLGRVDVVRLKVLQVRAEMLWLFLINVRLFFFYVYAAVLYNCYACFCSRYCCDVLLRLFFIIFGTFYVIVTVGLFLLLLQLLLSLCYGCSS